MDRSKLQRAVAIGSTVLALAAVAPTASGQTENRVEPVAVERDDGFNPGWLGLLGLAGLLGLRRNRQEHHDVRGGRMSGV